MVWEAAEFVLSTLKAARLPDLAESSAKYGSSMLPALDVVWHRELINYIYTPLLFCVVLALVLVLVWEDETSFGNITSRVIEATVSTNK